MAGQLRWVRRRPPVPLLQSAKRCRPNRAPVYSDWSACRLPKTVLQTSNRTVYRQTTQTLLKKMYMGPYLTRYDVHCPRIPSELETSTAGEGKQPSSIADPDEVEIIGIPKATSLLVEPRETSDPSISDALTFTQQERQSTTSWEPYRLKRHPSAISSRKGLKVFEKLIDDSPLLRSLSSEDRSMVIENWKEKKETVISLCEESEELELIRLDLQHLVEDRSLKDHPFQNDNQFSSTSSLLKLAGKSASLIKQAKLFELGQVSSDLKLRLILDNNIKGEWLKHFPNESIEIFPSNNFWFSYSKKLWEKMEGLLFGYKHQDFTEASKSYNPVLWKYVFKTMDLWFKEGFINEESIRSAFQNSKMMKPIIYYTISCIGDTEDEDITFESVSSITQIPNWPFSKYSLDEEEEKNINANFLVEKIYHFGGMLCEELGRPFSGWQTFTQNFSHQGFHSQLQAINDSNKNSMDSIKRLKNGQGLMHPPPEGLIKNLSMILKTTLDKPLEVEPLAEEVTFSKSQLVYAIHLYLEFVERNCFHGIVQLISEDAHQKSEDFKNKHKLIVCYLKAFEATTFEHTAFKSLLDYKNSEMELHEIDLILENNHQNSKTKFSEFKNLYKSTMENPHISNWLEDQVIIGQIFQAGEAEIEANETAIQFIKDFLHEKKLRD